MAIASGLARRVLIVGAVTIGSWCWTAQVSADVYWSNGGGGTIGRANLDGSGVNESFITGASNPSGLVVTSKYTYWANHSSGTIGRENADGTGVNQSFITAETGLEGLAVTGKYIYWANYDGTSIGRANLDGTGVTESFITGADHPYALVVTGKYVYWTNFDSDTIGRAKLDGTGANQSFIESGAYAPDGLVVTGKYIYWANNGLSNYGGYRIGRAKLDGTGVNQTFIKGEFEPGAMAADSKHLYWVNAGNGTIGRANLDGTGTNESFIAGANLPDGLAVTAGSGTVVTVTANLPTAFAFTLSAPGQPGIISHSSPKLTLPTGYVTFKVTNPASSILSHNFKVCDLGLKSKSCTGSSTPVLAPGAATATLTVDFTKPGTYTYLSSVDDDAFYGMRGKLVIT